MRVVCACSPARFCSACPQRVTRAALSRRSPLPSAVQTTVKYEIYTNGKYDSPTAACAAYAQSWTDFAGAWEVARYDTNQQLVADPNGDLCAFDIYHDGGYGSRLNIFTRHLCPIGYTAVDAWTCQLIEPGSTCPANSTGTPMINPTVCTCNDGYVPDSTRTSCVPNQYTITLQGGDTIEPGQSQAFTAKVEDQYHQPPKNPVTVNISLKVNSTSGGHAHGGTDRPRGGISGKNCDSDATCWSGTADSSNNGVVSFNFNSTDASGIHTVTATCDLCTNSPQTATVNVKVNGLEPIPASQLYALTDSGGNVIGGEQGKPHHDNHHLTAGAIGKLEILADMYKSAINPGERLYLNDASLKWGGLFDVGSTSWKKPHTTHRRGVEIDIRAAAATNGDPVKEGAIPFSLFHQVWGSARKKGIKAELHCMENRQLVIGMSCYWLPDARHFHVNLR